MSEIREIVIPKEQAVFWLDKNGCWNNEHGKFSHKKIIDYFNSCIRRDADGYYLTQINGDVREKVYFPCEDTAFFVTDIAKTDGEIRLILNTKAEIPLQPENLRVSNDCLYMQNGEDRIKFTERAMLKMADSMEYENSRYFFLSKGEKREIPQME
ncbi:MAG: MFS transporter permease [Desulfobacterales bacterium]